MANSDHRHGIRSTPKTGVVIVIVVLLVGLIGNVQAETARASGLPKVVIITGPVSECDGGPSGAIPRRIEISLHVLPSRRVVATYIIEPNKRMSFYSFAVTIGTYFLTTNLSLSKPPKGDLVISATSKSTVTAPISTVCQ
jgi:hypothetical protein